MMGYIRVGDDEGDNGDGLRWWNFEELKEMVVILEEKIGGDEIDGVDGVWERDAAGGGPPAGWRHRRCGVGARGRWEDRPLVDGEGRKKESVTLGREREQLERK